MTYLINDAELENAYNYGDDDLMRLFRLAFISNPDMAYNAIMGLGMQRLACLLKVEHSIGKLEEML